jgi:ribosome production factor 2
MGAKKVAKTHKGRRILESRQAKVIENPKKSFFMKGRKSSETLNTLMMEMHKMRGTGMSKLYTKKQHDIVAFEDASAIEK